MEIVAGNLGPAPLGVGARGSGMIALYAAANRPDAEPADALDDVTELVPVPEPVDLVAGYAARTAGHRNDLRGVILGHRAGTVLSPGAVGVGPEEALAILGEPIAFGRGTAAHREAVWMERVSRREARRFRQSAPAPALAARQSPATGRAPLGASAAVGVVSWRRPARGGHHGGRRRTAAAVIGALVLLVGAASTGLAQSRYRVQEGDSLDSVAATFGVDAAAIVAASAMPTYPDLTPGEVIVIPKPGQTPEEAATEAAALHGTSPWVVGAHVVRPGDTIADLAYTWGLASESLAAFNGIEDPENLAIGSRLLIPPSRDGVPPAGTVAEEVNLDPGPVTEAPEPEAGSAPIEPVAVGSFVASVGTYVQSRNLSCEYAAAYIATSAFGAGVPEWVFIEQVPAALNPHYGYRGNIDGWWGNTVDYGVYPEALAPVLNANGFWTSVFYGGAGDLTWHLDQGMPVLVWLGLWGDTAVTFYDEGTYEVAAGAHVVVAYGYDGDGVYVSDPANGSYRYFAWGDFSAMWSVFDGMAMGVAPY